MALDIRGYRVGDRDAVIALSLRAWAPVFASTNDVVGAELAGHLHGEDWREYQARSVRESLADPAKRGWVAEANGQITGFVVVATADLDRRIGEITMLAVDPAWQRHGFGRALTDHATAWPRDAGMRIAPREGRAQKWPRRRHMPAAAYVRARTRSATPSHAPECP